MIASFISNQLGDGATIHPKLQSAGRNGEVRIRLIEDAGPSGREGSGHCRSSNKGRRYRFQLQITRHADGSAGHLEQFVFQITGGNLDLDGFTLFPAQEGLANGRSDGNLVLFEVGFLGGDEPVFYRFV